MAIRELFQWIDSMPNELFFIICIVMGMFVMTVLGIISSIRMISRYNDIESAAIVAERAVFTISDREFGVDGGGKCTMGSSAKGKVLLKTAKVHAEFGSGIKKFNSTLVSETENALIDFVSNDWELKNKGGDTGWPNY